MEQNKFKQITHNNNNTNHHQQQQQSSSSSSSIDYYYYYPMLFTCSIGIPVRGSRNSAASTFVRTRLNLNLQTRWIRLAAVISCRVVWDPKVSLRQQTNPKSLGRLIFLQQHVYDYYYYYDMVTTTTTTKRVHQRERDITKSSRK